MGVVQEQPTMLLCDNQSCMEIARNPVFHACTKHIEVQYHFVRELILDGEVGMEYCPTVDNCAGYFHQSSWEQDLGATSSSTWHWAKIVAHLRGEH